MYVRPGRMEYSPSKIMSETPLNTHIPIHPMWETENLPGQSALLQEREETQEAKPCSSTCGIAAVVWTTACDDDISLPPWLPGAMQAVPSLPGEMAEWLPFAVEKARHPSADKVDRTMMANVSETAPHGRQSEPRLRQRSASTTHT